MPQDTFKVSFINLPANLTFLLRKKGLSFILFLLLYLNKERPPGDRTEKEGGLKNALLGRSQPISTK